MSDTAGHGSEYLEGVRHPGFTGRQGHPGHSGFTKLDDFPLIWPEGLEHPWLLAFSTMARRDDVVIDFTAGAGESWRRCLEAALSPLSLTWLSLEHGSKIAIVDSNLIGAGDGSVAGQAVKCPVADAAVVVRPGCAVAFTTADCLPIIGVSNKPRLAVAIHAGWRSLAAGIIEDCIGLLRRQYGVAASDMEFWVGPAIAAADYEVGEEVRQALLARPAIRIAIGSSRLLTPTRPGHYLADLPAAATAILTSLGVPAASIGRHPLSTSQSPLLHSLRRDHGSAGRMATVVGIKNE